MAGPAFAFSTSAARRSTRRARRASYSTIFAGFAQFEREMMLERQREGIAKAKAENRYPGRRPSARLKADEAVKLFKAGRTVTDIATALNIGRGSVYRALEATGMKSASCLDLIQVSGKHP